jgi:hypothetical protein
MAELGRPTVMTPETITKLEEAFLNMATDEQASFYAGIAPSTLYAFCKENPDFSERKEALKEAVKYRAKINLTKAVNEGDKQLSQWLLERRDPEFKPKQETEHAGNISVNVISFKDNNSSA